MATATMQPRAQLAPATGILGLGVLAAVADAALTWFAMQAAATRGHLAFTELNPAMRGLIHEIGGVGAMGIRVGVGVAVLGFLAWASQRSRWRWWPLAIATGLTWLAVAWNMGMLYLAVV